MHSKLKYLQKADQQTEILNDLIDAKLQLKWEIDELYWEKMAGINWLKVSDKNTKFFHSFASQRKKKEYN